MTLALLIAVKYGAPPFQGLPVEPVRVVTARLGAALGRPVTVQRALADLPVLVDAHGVGPGTTLRALAFALHASLVEDGRTLRLERTAIDLKAMRAAHVARNRARVAVALAQWDRILKRGDTLGDPAAQVRHAREEFERVQKAAHEANVGHLPYAIPKDMMGENMVSPGGRTLRRLVARFGPDRLADLDPGEVLFFSDHPTGVEKPLGIDFADLIDDYERDQAAYTTAMGLPESEPPAKMIVSVRESGMGFNLYDARGRKAGSGAIRYDMTPLYVGTVDPANPPPAPRWVELDEASRQMDAIFRTPEAFRAPIPEAYLYPERHDPLGFAVRAGLLALPREPGTKGFVVALSDGLLFWADGCVQNGRLDAAKFAFQTLGKGGGYERVSYGGTTVVRQQDGLTASFTDRSSLGRAVRRVVQEGHPTLSNWAALELAAYPGAHVAYRYLSWSLLKLVAQGYPTTSHDLGDSRLGNVEWAILGAAQAASTAVVDGTAPPFDRLLRDGVLSGLTFQAAPNASALDLTPSSLLARLATARIALNVAEKPVIERLGNTTSEEAARRFTQFGGTAEELGQEMMGGPETVPALRTEKRLQDKIQWLITDPAYRYNVGRRFTLAADVRLGNVSQTHFEAADTETQHIWLSFSELPPEFQAGILRGARAAFEGSKGPIPAP